MKIVLVEPLGVSKEKLSEIKKRLESKGNAFSSYDSKPKNDRELIERSREAEILVVVNNPVSAEVINDCTKLKMISVAFTGYDHVDLEACKKKGVLVSNSAGYSTDSVAELAIGFMITLLRNIVIADKVTRKGGIRVGIIGNELKGKTLGIIGTGAIGARVAELGKAFGCKLLGFSRTEKPEVIKLGLTYTDLETLLKQSDIVSMHSPLTKETENLIDSREFDLMKPSSFLIQTSRGGTVNESALAEALNSEKIAGAGIDVFVTESPLDAKNPLLKAKNTVVTPHVAFATTEALVKRADIAFANIDKWVKGKPQNIVSK